MILVLGATGFLGKRVCKRLTEKNIEFVSSSLSIGVDLRDKTQTNDLFKKVRPKVVINCASFVGGIQFGYKHPVELFSNNLKMITNLLEAAHDYEVEQFINPISNCVYPAEATLFKEEEIWNGAMHESVMVYGFVRKAFLIGAYAYGKQFGQKITNIVLSNMYGPEDHFEEERSHALGALIMKFVKAKNNNEPFVNVWGSGTPVREWMHVDDGAESLIRAIAMPFHDGPVNVGLASGISVIDMANLIKKEVDYKGEIKLDPSKPDGAPYKTVDGSLGEKLMGWKPDTNFEQGVKDTIKWYLENN
nr:NAD-dependent epimerase/dehydratase family protein [uncultured Flavobacterium sp.]